MPLAADDFGLDLPAVLQALDAQQPAVVFLAYPNNPTGNLFDAAAVEQIIRAAPGLVVVDEAYAPFTDASFMPRLGEFDNLVVMRTVSKLGLAGLRLGLLAGPPAWLDEFDKVRLPYNINVLTQASAEFALRHKAVFDRQTAQIRAERPRLSMELAAHDGVTVYPSEANFLLVRTPPGRARAWFDGLRQRGVLQRESGGKAESQQRRRAADVGGLGHDQSVVPGRHLQVTPTHHGASVPDDGRDRPGPPGGVPTDPQGPSRSAAEVVRYDATWWWDGRRRQYEGPARVLRGGSWRNNPPYVRSALRFRFNPDYRYDSIGFRLVVPLPPSPPR
mgnify:CR=1 FL=1